MKKLLVTAIGAAAAFGAVADTISTQRFESVTGDLPKAQAISDLNTLAGGDYWSGDELTNTYTVVSALGETFPQEKPLGPATKALEIKTTFGNPLTVKAIAGDNTSTNIPASGIYFDSLVKFTVCEEEPEQTYDGAKIIMWLQEQTDGGDNILGTNIMVRANYINADGTFTPTNFTCYSFDGSIDKWYRVTIKTWADITNGSGIPGFAIFIDNEPVNVEAGATMADAFASNLTEAAGYFGKTKVFASLVQGNAAGKSSITSASFDGTGKLTDLVFTDKAPFEAAEDYVAPEVAVTINGSSVDGIKTLAQAVAAVNVAEAGQVAKLSLQKGMTLDEALVFESPANVTFDFAGLVLTNAAAYYAITNKSGAITFIDSGTGGGITCTHPTAGAIYVSGGTSATIAGGTFRSAVKAINWTLLQAKIVHITGGSFEVKDGLEARAKSEGKMFELNELTGLYDVVDARYTVKFISGEGSTTNEYTDVVGEEVTVPTPAAVVGKTFSAWDPAIAGATVTIEADATYTAVYTINEYSVKFVYGLNKEYTNTVIGVTYNTVPTLPAEVTAACEVTGYTVTWPTFAAVTADATYEASYSANTYTVTFFTNSVEYTTATYTYGNAGSYSAPADPSVSGYTFGGWYTDNGTFESAFTFDADVAGDTQVAYAKLTEDAPVAPTIDPASDTAVVPVQEGETAEQAAARVEVGISSDVAAALTTAGVSGSTYQGYFSKTAVKDGDNWNVTAEFTDTVETAVATAAEAVVNGTATTVTIPAGLYYKVTTYTALGGTPTVAISSTLSTGAPSATISKPGDTQGFIKIELDTAPIK